MGAPETDREYERELRIKETLIREVHHRVKNNLQTIESLLRMQVRRSSDDEVRSALLEAITRIGAMAVVHEKLSFSDHEQLELTSLARAVSEQIKAGFMGGESGIAIHVIGEAGYLEAEAATSMALIIAETVHNAFEHGFADRQTGTIVIELGVIDDRLRVSIEDDGCGLDESFSLENTPNMGLTLIRTLVEDDLEGSICATSAKSHSGARFEFDVPLPPPPSAATEEG